MIPRAILVSTCASCYHTWNHIYPEMLDDFPEDLEVLHATEYIARLTAPVNVKPEFIGLVAAAGNNAVIGTNHGAHGTADTSVSRICFLPDTVIASKSGDCLLRNIRRGLQYALAKHPQLNGIYRTHRRALPAKGTFI